MTVLLFHLGNVPDDEAEDIRRLLAEHGFETYETHAGFWRLGVAAIWLRHASQEAAARELIERYQTERRQRLRQEQAARLARGEQPTLWRRLLQHPVQMLLIALAVAAVLALTLLPFLGLIEPFNRG
ncbi:DUF6164 family protein [Halomonas sp. NO4]|uniref:DUF6164 family protein n=1 Tax=Halomonas sp. NO4 TaxID=2484813 RepID=UPI0013D3E7BA|nr:DUF6164 family protein [Halomonas sp. NO4]